MLECQLLRMRNERTKSLTNDQTISTADFTLLTRKDSAAEHKDLSLAETYFGSRISELINQCQLADSKVEFYQKEVRSRWIFLLLFYDFNHV